MMAWVRTSVSLISFGFSIYKFFDFFREGRVRSTGMIGPRQFAMAMISIGVFALVAALVQHWWDVRERHKAGVGSIRWQPWLPDWWRQWVCSR
jgi:inner membrane protein YidH